MGDTVRVIEGRTTGEIVRALMDRAGHSIRSFAQAAGYKHGSGVQRYVDADFDEDLHPRVAEKLAGALEGRGTPPIERAEIMILTGLSGQFEAKPNTELAPKYRELDRDVPVYGTALGTYTENEVIEQSIVSHDDPIDYFIRPAGVANRKGVYGLYVTGESQSPRFKPGEIIFVDPTRTPMIGDDVVVYLRQPEGEGETISAILLKELTRRGHDRIELRQLNPQADFSVSAVKVKAVHRVLTNADLFGGYR